MKKILFIFALMFISSNVSFAQIENIKVSETVTVNQIYAGILSWSAFSIDSLHYNYAAEVRVGGAVTWRPSNWFAVKSMAMFQAEINNKSRVMNQVTVIINPVKALTISFGNTGTLVTEQRPYPVTGAGQFETWTQAQIPGMALCAKASWQISKDWSIGAGIAERNEHAEYQANIRFKKVTVSAFYDEWNQKFGTVFTADIWRFSETFVYKQDVVANTLIFQAGPKKDWCLYVDLGYDLASSKLVRGEVGVLKDFSLGFLKGLVGPGYCYEDRSVHFYTYLHL